MKSFYCPQEGRSNLPGDGTTCTAIFFSCLFAAASAVTCCAPTALKARLLTRAVWCDAAGLAHHSIKYAFADVRPSLVVQTFGPVSLKFSVGQRVAE